MLGLMPVLGVMAWGRSRVRAMAWVRAMARVRVNVRVRVIACAILKARVRAIACFWTIARVRANAMAMEWAKAWVEVGRGSRLSRWCGRMPGLGLWLAIGLTARAWVKAFACVARIRRHGLGTG